MPELPEVNPVIHGKLRQSWFLFRCRNPNYDVIISRPAPTGKCLITSPAGFRKTASASLAQKNCGRLRGCAVAA